MTDGNTLRAGIVGAGFMADVHARAIRAAGHEVVGISASTPTRSQDAAARMHVRTGFSTWSELVNSPDVDVVHVCTPNNLHVDLSLAAMAAGKAVVCEKPLATTLADASALLEQAGKARTPTAVPFIYRYYPAVQEIKSRIEQGEAGDLLLLHGSYLQDWLATQTATNWRVDSVQGGISRTFADIGVHWCDLMEFVTGHRITRLAANFTTSFGKRGSSGSPTSVGTEDAAMILFETDRAAAGSLTVSQVSRGRKNRLWFSFDGNKGSYEFNQESPDSFWIGGLNENRTIMSGTGAITGEDARRHAFLPAGHPQGYQDAFNAFVADAYASFQGRVPSGLPTFVDGYRAAAITDAVIASARSKTWVDVVPAVPQASKEPSSLLAFDKHATFV
jgi:predicted dehydrogenase